MPSDEQRALVKLAVSDATFTHDDICELIKNPYSGKPIDRNTLVKHFSEELRLGRLEVRVTMTATLVAHAKKGSLGHHIWYEKTRLGIRDPSDEPRINAKIDAANAVVKHEVVINGGLPANSTAQNPEGDSPAIPPEESHG